MKFLTGNRPRRRGTRRAPASIPFSGLEALEARALLATVQFSASAVTVLESDGSVPLPLQLTGDFPGVGTVRLRAVGGGTATIMADFSNYAGAWAFESSPESRNVIFPVNAVINDTAMEGDETFTFELFDVTGEGVTIGTPSVLTVRIVDDDSPYAEFGLASNAFDASETDSKIVVQVLRKQGTSTDVAAQIPYSITGGTAVAGTDYLNVSGVLDFPAGSLSRPITIPLLDDLLVDGSRTIVLTLGNPTNPGVALGDVTAATITIADNEQPATLAFQSATVSALENAGKATITVVRAGGLTQPAQVGYRVDAGGTAVTGTDFLSVSGTVDFLAGQETATFDVPLIDNSILDGTRTVFLALEAPSGSGVSVGTPASTTLSILDDEVASQLAFQNATASAPENQPTVLLTIVRQGATTQAATVTWTVTGGTALFGQDYSQQTGTVTIPAGETSAELDFSQLDDALVDGARTVIITLSDPTGAGVSLGGQVTNTITLRDNEAGRFSFNQDSLADLAFWRLSTGRWYVTDNKGATIRNGTAFGRAGDIPLNGDFDGDGKTDLAYFRPSTGLWNIRASSGAADSFTRTFGRAGDVPVVADYNGDGKTDLAYWRPSDGSWNLSVRFGTSPFTRRVMGRSGDIPTPGDYNGDGRADLAYFRPSTGQWSARTGGGRTIFSNVTFGRAGDIPVPGDYNGDRKTDMAYFRPSNRTWNIKTGPTTAAQQPISFGIAGDVPVPADYDGDGRTDIAVWRPSTRQFRMRLARIANPVVITTTVSIAQGTDLPTLSPLGVFAQRRLLKFTR